MTVSGDVEWPKVADAVIEALIVMGEFVIQVASDGTVFAMCPCQRSPLWVQIALSDRLSELGRNHVGEQVKGTRDAFMGDASAHIGFDNESRQT